MTHLALTRHSHGTHIKWYSLGTHTALTWHLHGTHTTLTWHSHSYTKGIYTTQGNHHSPCTHIHTHTRTRTHTHITHTHLSRRPPLQHFLELDGAVAQTYTPHTHTYTHTHYSPHSRGPPHQRL